MNVKWQTWFILLLEKGREKQDTKRRKWKVDKEKRKRDTERERERKRESGCV